MQALAQRAFITYLRSIYKKSDKEVFDVMKLNIEEFSASLGLPMTPTIRFLNRKAKNNTALAEAPELRSVAKDALAETSTEMIHPDQSEEQEQLGNDFLTPKDTEMGGDESMNNGVTAV